jgi:uncharacterized protein YraI
LWICLFCISVVVSAQSEQEVEIIDFFAKVYLAPNEKSKFVGLAQKGERYPITDQHDTWVRIRFKNAIGWIYSSQVGPVGSIAARAAEQAAKDSIKAVEANAVALDTVVPEQNTKAPTAEPPVPVEKPDRYYTRTDRRSEPAGSPNNQEPPREEKPRNWFTKKSQPQLPSFSQDLTDTTILFFQVTFGPARVLSYLDPEAPILGMARKGDMLPLIGEGDSWCKIMFHDTVGWIEHRYGKVVENVNTFDLFAFLPVLIVLGVLLIGFLIVFIILRLRPKRNPTITVNVKKHVLIIAKTSKEIQYTLTDSVESLERCFLEIGFTITTAKDNQAIRDALSQSSPDVVLVDWKFDRNILTSLERLFATMPGSEHVLFIIYNVPDPGSMRPSRILPSMTYLGNSFSDRDIFKIVTPLIISETNRNMQKSVQSSALEGEIGDGNLLEVLQFIEIGRKSGCLLIETDRPFGLIYFTDGRIVYAATAQGILSRDAIFAVLNLKAGKFRFVANKRPKATNLNLSTLEVLMEWTKAVDEAHGN